jgi:hypothetical protein
MLTACFSSPSPLPLRTPSFTMDSLEDSERPLRPSTRESLTSAFSSRPALRVSQPPFPSPAVLDVLTYVPLFRLSAEYIKLIEALCSSFTFPLFSSPFRELTFFVPPVFLFFFFRRRAQGQPYQGHRPQGSRNLGWSRQDRPRGKPQKGRWMLVRRRQGVRTGVCRTPGPPRRQFTLPCLPSELSTDPWRCF